MRTSIKARAELTRQVRQLLGVQRSGDIWPPIIARLEAVKPQLAQRGWGAALLSPYCDSAWTIRAYKNVGAGVCAERVKFLTPAQVVSGDLLEIFLADLELP